MNPLASTFIVLSTCVSCPSASTRKTVSTSPNRTVGSCRSIGRYETASRKVPLRSTTNRPTDVSSNWDPNGAAMPLACRSASTPGGTPSSASGPSGARSLDRARSCSNAGVSTAPVSIWRSSGGSALSSGRSGHPRAAASAHESKAARQPAEAWASA
eukprot:scaffold30374_cov107-Isochrysis_galbana.AAC.6